MYDFAREGIVGVFWYVEKRWTSQTNWILLWLNFNLKHYYCNQLTLYKNKQYCFSPYWSFDFPGEGLAMFLGVAIFWRRQWTWINVCLGPSDVRWSIGYHQYCAGRDWGRNNIMHPNIYFSHPYDMYTLWYNFNSIGSNSWNNQILYLR